MNGPPESGYSRGSGSSSQKKKYYTNEELFGLAEEAVEEQNQDEHGRSWVMTFGDLMSLLLVFFVMLFAMSELKVQKFAMIAESLQTAFGGGVGAPKMMPLDSLAIDSTRTGGAEIEVDQFLLYIEKQLNSFVAEYKLANSLQVTVDAAGVSLSIQDLVLFDVGSAELKPEAQWIVEKLSEIVNKIAVPVIVSGHTDSTPISTERYPSNWELSGARASTLARLFIERGFEPEGIHIEGYSDTRPVAENDTEEGRAKNRRVELLYTRQNVLETLLDNRELGMSTIADSVNIAINNTVPPDSGRDGTNTLNDSIR